MTTTQTCLLWCHFLRKIVHIRNFYSDAFNPSHYLVGQIIMTSNLLSLVPGFQSETKNLRLTKNSFVSSNVVPTAISAWNSWFPLMQRTFKLPWWCSVLQVSSLNTRKRPTYLRGQRRWSGKWRNWKSKNYGTRWLENTRPLWGKRNKIWGRRAKARKLSAASVRRVQRRSPMSTKPYLN